MTKTFTLAPKRGEYVDVTDLWAQEKYSCRPLIWPGWRN